MKNGLDENEEKDEIFEKLPVRFFCYDRWKEQSLRECNEKEA
jgi:hypothetical protein